MNVKFTELPVEERLRLVEDLRDSIVAEQAALPLTAPQKAELQRRLDAYALDRNPGRPASEVLNDIRQRP